MNDDQQSPTAFEKRPEFLIAMYDQLMSDINRHIVVVWQMAGVVAAAVAAVFLSEKNGFPMAYGVCLFLGVCLWAIDHIHDSNYWYNRNLVMITNIERVFLRESDTEIVHPYFASHRKTSSFLTHLKIQRNYIIGAAVAAIAYFTFESALPSLDSNAELDVRKLLPFLLLIFLLYRDHLQTEYYEKKYSDYLALSPGIKITKTLDFKETHGSH